MLGVMGMGKIGLMAAGNHHSGTIARTHISQGDQDVNLATHELAVAEKKLGAFDAFVAARVQRDRFAGTTQVNEVLIDEQGAMEVIIGTFTTDEELDFLKPGWVVDEFLEGLTRFVDLLQVQPIVGAKVRGMATVPSYAGSERSVRDAR